MHFVFPGMMKRTGEIKDASTIPLPLASEAEPTPDDQIMKSFHTGDPQFMLEQMPDKLRTYVDEVELKKRLQRIAHHWPPLSESEISSREDHPTVGDLQQTLILKFREDSDARAVITLARTPDGKFLGFEFESGRMRLGSLTALKNVDEISGITRKLIETMTAMRLLNLWAPNRGLRSFCKCLLRRSAA